MAEEKVPRHWPSRLVRPYQHTLQGVSARRAASSTFLSSGRPHLPEVMLGVLVVVLGRDLVTAHGGITRQRKVAFVALLRIARHSSAMTAAGGQTLSAHRVGSATLHVQTAHAPMICTEGGTQAAPVHSAHGSRIGALRHPKQFDRGLRHRRPLMASKQTLNFSSPDYRF